MFEQEMRAALATLVVEAGELLAEMETGLLDLESGTGDSDTVNAVFRAAHTIKGSGGLFGLDAVVAFTHVVESVLDRLRGNEIAVSPDLIGALLPCVDHIAVLIDAVDADGVDTGSDVTAQNGALLLAGLQPFLAQQAEVGARTEAGSQTRAGAHTEAGADSVGAGERHPAEIQPPASEAVQLTLWFGPDTLRCGMDPLSFISYLRTLGELRSVHTLTERLPVGDLMDAETCYLGFEIVLETSADLAEIESVFEFVRDESDIRVVRMVTEPSIPQHLAVVSADASTEQVRIPLTPTGSSPAASGVVAERRQTERVTLRVDAARLDRLLDTVGELVIAGAGASLEAGLIGKEGLQTAMDEVMRLIEGVRDNALRLRMVPIGTTFSRFQRVVRDVSADLGKDVALVITGGETEVDKALVEHIGDPLMHLVRNALDHGIEAADVRLAQGKPERGTLRLDAYHDSGSIVVVIADDGGGIDTERVLAKAVERGLVPAGAAPTEKEIHALLFEPGFSTADAVSNLSGRGVGMDVVRRNVTALRGTVELESRPGLGTTVRIRLPLTLAIIDGFMVGVGSATYVIPLDRVVECVELLPASRRRDYMDLRGEVMPLIRLRSFLSIDGPPATRESVVVVEDAGMKTGLVVDLLKGEFQTVIKPLGKLFAHVEGIGGSTILGSGDVALIIDVPMLVRRAIQLANRRVTRVS